MKTTKKQLVTLVYEVVRRTLHEVFAKQGFTIVTMHDLEIGPVQVSAKITLGRRATRTDPEESAEVEVNEFILDGEVLSMEELLDKENQLRMELGVAPLNQDELMRKAEVAVTEDYLMRGDSSQDDLYELFSKE